MYTSQLIISFVTIGILYYLMNLPKKKEQNVTKQENYTNNRNINNNYNYPTINNQPIFSAPPNQILGDVEIPVNMQNIQLQESFSSYTNVSPEIKKDDTKTAKIAFVFLTIGILYLLYDKYSESKINDI